MGQVDYLSATMKSSEKLLAYSSTYSMELGNSNSFIISLSHSQGFAWNQDLFASQHQQMCKVVYDGHEDNMNKLLKYIHTNESELQKEFINNNNDDENLLNEAAIENDEVDFNDEFDDKTNRLHHYRTARRESSSSIVPRIKADFNRPRRKSSTSISFSADSKVGNYNRTEVDEIDIEDDTKENKYFKWLAS